MSVGQIRQVLDRMYVSYKIMCMKGKGEIEACKCLIQCFTGTLTKWWEIELSPALLEKMEKEVLRDDARDIIFHEDGKPQSNMIGALTTMILEHWCGIEHEISDKHSLILMNSKCKSMANYDDFHREWMQRSCPCKFCALIFIRTNHC